MSSAKQRLMINLSLTKKSEFLRTITTIISLAFITIACKKVPLKDNCGNLKDAIVNDDVSLAISAVDNIISTLPNAHYSQADLQGLANRLTTDCHLTTEVLCYSCIKTNPPQSEIRISATLPGTVKVTVVDISYNSTNRMTCLDMHH
jgi:hypothetical protein